MLLCVWRTICVWIWQSTHDFFFYLFPSFTWYKNPWTDLCTCHFETMSTFCKFHSGQKGGGAWVSLSLNSNSDEVLVSILVRGCLWVSRVCCGTRYFYTKRKKGELCSPQTPCSIKVYSFCLDLKARELILYCRCGDVRSGSCTVSVLFSIKVCFELWAWIDVCLFSKYMWLQF